MKFPRMGTQLRDDALYLDGDICAIYLPELGYRGEDPGTRFAGMFAVAARRKAANAGSKGSY